MTASEAEFAEGLEAALGALGRGGLVAVATETVYGLAADATDPDAVARIFAAKARPRFNPLIAHVGSRAAAEGHGLFDRQAAALADAFWPGPLTLVVERRAASPVCDLACAGLDTIALRVPDGAAIGALLAGFEKPLAAPSANRSGHVSATTADHVERDLGDRVDVILDTGPTPVGIESTIVACLDGRVALLRPGGLAVDRIEAVLGRPVERSGAAPGSETRAPGMLASHYAPATPLELEARSVAAGSALLAFGPDLPADADNAVMVRNLSPSGDLREAATRLFAALRTLDDAGASRIAVMPVPEAGLGEAINDRLRRAAAGS